MIKWFNICWRMRERRESIVSILYWISSCFFSSFSSIDSLILISCKGSRQRSQQKMSSKSHFVQFISSDSLTDLLVCLFTWKCGLRLCLDSMFNDANLTSSLHRVRCLACVKQFYNGINYKLVIKTSKKRRRWWWWCFHYYYLYHNAIIWSLLVK